MPEVCPNCGADVPPGARACPECGSDEQTGWSTEAERGALGIPDEDFDYEEYVQREFGGKKPAKQRIHWVWWLVTVGLVLLFLGAFVVRL